LIRLVLFFAFVAAFSGVVSAQGDPQPYARKNSFGVLMAYSNDSSHMLLGVAERRKLLNIGVSYSRKLLMTRFGAWMYDGELLPVALESDPLGQELLQDTAPKQTSILFNVGAVVSCAPSTLSFSYKDPNTGTVYSGTETTYCHGRQWNVGEAISPAGLQWNFRPRSRIQPLIEGHGGYMYSTQPVPVFDAGSFNFTFDFGGGIEFFRSHSRSIRAEYRYHHISNDDMARANPGVDSGLFQLSYVFGR
jgi:hypothetical protein